MNVTKVIPRISRGAIFAPSSLSTNGFTIGREYKVVNKYGNAAVVFNDNGHERVVLLDGSPCAHIVSRYELPTGRPGYGYPMQKVVGYFEVAEMNLHDILIADAERAFLTRKQRLAIRSALAELNRLRTTDLAAENVSLREQLEELKEKRQ